MQVISSVKFKEKNSSMEEIREIRDIWLQAYLDGNTEKLAKIESDGFSIISGQGIETNPSRLEKISARKLSDQWFKPSASFQNTQMEYQHLGSVVTVTGLFEIKAKNKVIRSSYVSEVWQKINNNWQITLAHASSKNEV